MLLTAILLCLYCSLLIDSSFILPFKKMASLLNHICESSFNNSNFSSEINRSLVCGSKLQSTHSIKYYFSQLGVVHLLVASGAHLYFLKSCILFCLKFMPFSRKLKYSLLNFLLLIYVAVSGFNPPLLRAFVSLVTIQHSRTNKLYWRPLTALLISIAISLFLDTKLWLSLSLVLSWTVCCVLSLNLKPLKKCIVIYLASFPVLMQFQWVHPVSIFTNLLFAPVFSIVHFPLSFLSLFSDHFSLLSDHAWSFTLELFTRIHQNINLSSLKIKVPIYWLWAYCFVLHFSVSIYTKYKNRRFYFS